MFNNIGITTSIASNFLDGIKHISSKKTRNSLKKKETKNIKKNVKKKVTK